LLDLLIIEKRRCEIGLRVEIGRYDAMSEVREYLAQVVNQ
jgi:hypothetical protein